jgi:N-acetylglucosaminyldiphosphoundecaprenol N-acetyl-beta-D-mannosaminyltransferase
MTAPLSAVRAQETRVLFHYRFSTTALAPLADEIARLPEPGQGVRSVVTANLDHIVQLRVNPQLRSAYDNAWRRTIDGTPVLLYARMRNGDAARVTGADLLPQVLNRVGPAAHRLFFVVADEATADGLRRWAATRGFAAGAVAIEIPPFGFESDIAYSQAMAERARAHGTTHLIFGVGCPKSEVWIDQNRALLGDCYALAVGAAVNFFTGTQRRAPRIFRRVGMEWAWRVYREPRRLAHRYFVSSWSFLAALVDDMRGSQVIS